MAAYIDTYDIATQGINSIIDSTFTIVVSGFHVDVDEIIIPPIIDGVGAISSGGSPHVEEEYKKLIRLKVTLPSGELIVREVTVNDVDLTVDDVELDPINESVTIKLTDVTTRKKSVKLKNIKLHE